MRRATTRALMKGWWSEAIEPFLRQSTPASPCSAAVPASSHPEISIATKPTLQPLLLKLSGVVYTCVLNPEDGRKNWIDLISAFCWAFKNEGDATLILKMVHSDPESYRINVMTHLSRLSPFKCRVLVVHGYLDAKEYRRLVEVSTFYVNSSACEGLCLPLVEYLCSGKPAISPMHTAMLDYLNADMAVLVESSTEPASFLHDPANLLRTRRYRQSWESLVQAYQTSYQIATSEPERYRQMSVAARSRLRDFCTVEHVSQTLAAFLTSRAATVSSIKNRGFQV
jgi:glycosyltransferase involved in cell wall biosynthesis